MRREFLILAAGAAGAAAAFAAPAAAQGTYRERSVVVYGTDACPKPANPDEIVVCTRRPEEERFRIPRNIREQDATNIARRDNVAEQRAALASGRPSAAGIGSCSPVGPGGMIGCTPGINLGAAARTIVDGVNRATEPDDE